MSCVWSGESVAVSLASVPCLGPGGVVEVVNASLQALMPLLAGGGRWVSLGRLSATVEAPAARATLALRISAPSVVGVCADLVADATGSMGWVAVPPRPSCPHDDLQWTFDGVAIPAPSGLLLRVNSSSLLTGGTPLLLPAGPAVRHGLSLQLTTMFGDSAAVALNVTKLSTAGGPPSVRVLAPAAAYRARPLVLTADGSVACCTQPCPGSRLTFQWAQSSGPSVAVCTLANCTGPVLVIPAWTLRAGSVYGFAVTATDVNGSTATAAASVDIQPLPPVLQLTGGSRSVVLSTDGSGLTPLVIDAGSSFSPDQAPPRTREYLTQFGVLTVTCVAGACGALAESRVAGLVWTANISNNNVADPNASLQLLATLTQGAASAGSGWPPAVNLSVSATIMVQRCSLCAASDPS